MHTNMPSVQQAVGTDLWQRVMEMWMFILPAYTTYFSIQFFFFFKSQIYAYIQRCRSMGGGSSCWRLLPWRRTFIVLGGFIFKYFKVWAKGKGVHLRNSYAFPASASSVPLLIPVPLMLLSPVTDTQWGPWHKLIILQSVSQKSMMGLTGLKSRCLQGCSLFWRLQCSICFLAFFSFWRTSAFFFFFF